MASIAVMTCVLAFAGWATVRTDRLASLRRYSGVLAAIHITIVLLWLIYVASWFLTGQTVFAIEIGCVLLFVVSPSLWGFHCWRRIEQIGLSCKGPAS